MTALDRPLAAGLLAAFAGVVGTTIGALQPSAWLWPVLATLLVYPIFVRGVVRGRLGMTVGLMLVWALASSVTFWVVEANVGTELGARVIRGPAYADEMLHWVETGEGPEGSPRLFLPLHARHYAGFLVASAATGSFAGLAFGVVLLNYMNFYVASLAQASGHLGAYLIGWPVWAVVRVVGFVAGGTALGHFFLTRLLRRGTWSAAGFRRWMLVSVGLVLLDVLLKATLAEPWRGLLGRLF